MDPRPRGGGGPVGSDRVPPPVRVGETAHRDRAVAEAIGREPGATNPGSTADRAGRSPVRSNLPRGSGRPPEVGARVANPLWERLGSAGRSGSEVAARCHGRPVAFGSRCGPPPPATPPSAPPQIMAPRPRPRNRSWPPGSSLVPGRRLGGSGAHGPTGRSDRRHHRTGRGTVARRIPTPEFGGSRRIGGVRGGGDGTVAVRTEPVPWRRRRAPGEDRDRRAAGPRSGGAPGHPGTGPKNSSQWPSGSRVKTRFSRASRIRATMGSLRRRSSASHPSTSETRKPRWSNSVPRRCGS